MTWDLRRAVAALGALLITLGLVAGPAGAATAPVPGPVVLLGTAGLRWDDVDIDTPALQALLANGSLAALVPRSVELTACPVDGWLALSAGRRADAARADDGSCLVPTLDLPTPGGVGRALRWADYRDRAAAQGFDAEPGALGEALARAGRRSAAIGPGAVLGLARADGTTTPAWAADDILDTDEPLKAALATRPDVLAIDLGPLTAATEIERTTAVKDLDARLTLILEALPDAATVIVTSLADDPAATAATARAASTPSEPAGSAGGGSGARMQFTAIVGARPGGGQHPPALLFSPSTRQDGLVLTTDVAPTILDLLGVTVPATMDGSPVHPSTGTSGDEADRLEHLLDLDLAAVELQPLFGPVVAVSVVIEAFLAIVLAWLLRIVRTPALHRRLRAGLHAVGIAGGCLPAATVLAGLAPWWRADSPGSILGLVVMSWVVALATIALVGPWRRRVLGPAGAVGALTALVLTADVAAGSPLSLTTIMGGQPLIAGRFYGFGNPLFAVFGAAVLLFALAVADVLLPRGVRPAVIGVSVVGLLAAVIDVLPSLGADVGGAPALIPAFAVLALRLSGLRVTWRRALLIASGTVLLVAAVAVADWLRPDADRTHLGRFVQTTIDGGAWNVIRRKGMQNLEILTSSPLTMLIPVAVALFVWVLIDPARFRFGALQTAYQRVPLLTHGLVALGVLLAIAFAANDSGTSIPPAAGLLAVPLLIAITARASGDEVPDPTAPRPGRR